jgi:hypothetical protein
MTTVHEAAIANGWNPADGSLWVGPDGITYPSKDAFYASQTVAHRENCLCPKAQREQPARMLNEREWSFSSLDDAILDLLAKRLAEADAPMVRTYKRRYNAAGEGIGPELGIRSCDAWLFWRVLDRVLVVVERGAERQR